MGGKHGTAIESKGSFYECLEEVARGHIQRFLQDLLEEEVTEGSSSFNTLHMITHVCLSWAEDMKVLVISAAFPPMRAGEADHALHLCEHLAERRLDVRVRQDLACR